MLYKLEFTCHKDHITLFEEIICDTQLTFTSSEVKSCEEYYDNEVLFDYAPNLQVLTYLFKEEALKHHIESPYLSLSVVPEIDWLAENRKSFNPLTIGNFFIYNSYYEESIPQDKITFLIDAATAFGTGSHATTQGCLFALQDLKEQGFLPSKALDIGCGTGILGMAIARLFNIPVVTSDYDEDAIEKTLLNIKENKLDNLISCYLSQGFNAEILKQKGPYNLITANILAEPLIELAAQMKYHTTQQGIVILSGLLTSQAEAVSHAYQSSSFEKIKRYPIEDWMTLVMKKSG